MADALLPPDPTREAHYWLRGPEGYEVSAKYRHNQWRVMGDPAYYGAMFMAQRGYTLASPHPIPTAAQLDAVYKLLSDIDDAARLSDFVLTTMIGDRLRAALKGDAP